MKKKLAAALLVLGALDGAHYKLSSVDRARDPEEDPSVSPGSPPERLAFAR